jgi:hypothetical protein
MSHKPVLLSCMFAPTIRYHEGRYYMITILVDGSRNFYVLASGELTSEPHPVWRGTEKRYPATPPAAFDLVRLQAPPRRARDRADRGWSADGRFVS